MNNTPHRTWLNKATISPVEDYGREEIFNGVLFAALLQPDSAPPVLRALLKKPYKTVVTNVAVRTKVEPIDIVVGAVVGNRPTILTLEVKGGPTTQLNEPNYKSPKAVRHNTCDHGMWQTAHAHRIAAEVRGARKYPTECEDCHFKQSCPTCGCHRCWAHNDRENPKTSDGRERPGKEQEHPWVENNPLLYTGGAYRSALEEVLNVTGCPATRDWRFVVLDRQGRKRCDLWQGWESPCDRKWTSLSMGRFAGRLRKEFENPHTNAATRSSLTPLLACLPVP